MTLRNTLVSVACGLLFSLGWWLLIDGILQSKGTFLFSYSLPAVFCTMAGIALNLVSKEHMLETSDLFSQGDIGGKTRLWTFSMLTIAFVCIGGSIWILAQHYSDGPTFSEQWPGVALLFNTILVFISAVAFFIARS